MGFVIMGFGGYLEKVVFLETSLISLFKDEIYNYEFVIQFKCGHYM